MVTPSSLEVFMEEVRSSCTDHAVRKGYLEDKNNGRNALGDAMKIFGIEGDHAIGEILTKSLEWRQSHRKLLAVKIAGWAWRLWVASSD